MRTDTAPTPTLLSDYEPPSHELTSVYLDFDLQPEATTVRSKIEVKRLRDEPFILNGEEIELKSVKIDGKVLKRSAYKLDQEKLVLAKTPESFTLEIETVCNPKANSKLMGLYVSGGRFCTQCEAEGFRRITFFPDRPDVMSVFTVRMEADMETYPFLLANGNKTESGAVGKGRHFAVWHDPFRKPAYLFALVAGQFDLLEDSFTTMSGRHIPLEIYVDPGNAPQAEYAMDALKRSMKWDEDAFGREYDLDLFMIVAVRDFNFGAMENKGLNIFNSALLLADAESATDMNFERIESVVAHEYFHNWTGNRITCRDWFQLCLKEGFTVFRDQEFSADQRGAAVQRIKDVRALRARQFAEDAGPLAHPVRPESYMKIDNFYTATVYEKGAELIRMLKTILGAEKFRAGCDHYFEKLDGTAATIEQFLKCFEEATGEDLSQFMLWYQQAGTPILTVKRETVVNQQRIHFKQATKPTPGQPRKSPVVLPIKWQLVGDNGPLSEPQLKLLKHDATSVSYPAITEPHSVSVLQDFSAPVTVRSDATTEDLLRLMAADPNAFNRWEAGQTLARQLIASLAKAIESGKTPPVDKALKGYCEALARTLDDPKFNNAFKALALTPPAPMEVLQSLDQSDPLAVHEAGKWLSRAVADYLRDTLLDRYHALTDTGAFSPDASSAGRRALRNRCLALLAARHDPLAATLAQTQFAEATNMTDELSALMTLTRLGGQRVETTMEDFYSKWEKNPLVLDKWFSVQAMRPHAGGVSSILRLADSTRYERTNPNRVRALVGGFAMGNAELFHKADGSGYSFFTDQIIDMDSRNPQIAARLLGAFEIWRKLDDKRQVMIRSELQRVINSKPSKNVLEIAKKTLGE
ncbi:aminopeptidase N [Litorimonas sp. WD9-15]|uniref:aminopeptidase N n=1 Tax=Litorimonas sp. WD9-15 TaxID=3418716 RepID=UPI003D03E403